MDQFTKVLAVQYLALKQSAVIIKGFFNFSLVHNRGAAFGILKNQVPFFIITAIFAVILIYFNLKENRTKQPFIYRWSLVLILAGGLGNLIDRLRCGYVIDFLDFRIWPVFNIADSAITVGAILLGYTLLITRKESVGRRA